jgi:hypothetical protein
MASEYWLNNNIFVSESENGNIWVTFYYGKYRKYAIKGVTTKQPNKEDNIKKIIKEIKAASKVIEPLHGCTHYL